MLRRHPLSAVKAAPTPRHAVAAVAIGDQACVAGGGAIPGGGAQSLVHEAFTLA